MGFERSPIPNVIDAQLKGELLHVEGFGSFNIEWHMSGDLKTLKCMFGVEIGANATHPCIYCMQTQCLHNKRCANKLVIDGMYEWANGVMSGDQTTAPNQDKFDEKWDAILNIPLERVHCCVLHAEMRLIDKLLFLHIMYV